MGFVKQSKITPGSNLMWEASRMMLPEHKERLIQHKKEQNKKQRPELDEQQIEEIDLKIRMSQNYTTEVAVTIFGEYGDRVVKGIVARIDPQLQKIKLELEDGYEWIRIDEILQIDDV